jgi:hypothetical protein
MTTIQTDKLDGYFWQRNWSARSLRWGERFTAIAFTEGGALRKLKRTLQIVGDR